MSRFLVLSCSKCGKVRQLHDPNRDRASELGAALRLAEKNGFEVALRSGSVEIGCECDSSELDSPGESRPSYRFNLLQLLLVITTAGILLAIFRHPISMLFDDNVRQWAAIPWSFYGWLFFDGTIIDHKGLTKSLIGVLAMLVNVAIASLFPIALAVMGGRLFRYLWKLAGEKNARPLS